MSIERNESSGYTTKHMSKLKYLDGLRGVAACVVVMHHFFLAFFPAIHSGLPKYAHADWDLWVSRNPLDLLFAGNFAVAVFFVLSGFVLSYRFFAKGDTAYPTAAAVKRYVRLIFPIAFSLLAGYVLLKLGWFYNDDIFSVTKSDYWLGRNWNFEPNFFVMLRQIIYGALITFHFSYNDVLWTMKWEFFGSLLVFANLALIGRVRHRWVFYVALILVFWKTWYLAFVLGMVLCDLYHHGHAFARELLSLRIVSVMLIIFGLLLGSYPNADVTGTWYELIRFDYFGTLHYQLYHVIGAALLMLGLLYFRPLQWVLSRRPMVWIGKISFAMYVMHFIVITSLSSYLFTVFYPEHSYERAVAIVFGLTWAALIPLSYLVYRFVDAPGIRVANQMYKRWFKH